MINKVSELKVLMEDIRKAYSDYFGSNNIPKYLNEFVESKKLEIEKIMAL